MNSLSLANALFTIASRDVTKLLRDRARLVMSFVFPMVFVMILGGSLDANLSGDVGYNFLAFVFTGVIGQNLFQSTASGIISLIEDRENDFAQEMFVAPIPRWGILLGKIMGESLVALTQLISILLLGFVLGIPFSLQQFFSLIPVFLIICLFGGAFGTLVMANLNDQRKAGQVFPFLLFPQFFLAGVFSPIQNLPIHLYVLSRLAPMTYAVDLVRGVYYWGKPEYAEIVLYHPATNLAIIGLLFTVMVGIGTYMFIRNERNR